MKKLFLPALASALLMLGACSANRLAQSSNNDDVYNSQAKAKEVDYAQAQEKNYRTDEQLYGGNDYSENTPDYDYDYDYGYASRLNRFYYGIPGSSYYDPWYAYSYNPWYGSYYYNDPWAYSSGFSLWLGFGSFPYNTWAYNPWSYYGYGYPNYYGNYWGPVSYYGYGGYYGSGNRTVERSRPYLGNGNPNYRRGTTINGTSPRPVMSGSDRYGTRSSRPDTYNTPSGSSRTTTSAERESQPTSRPARPSRTESRESRPERTYTPPERTPSYTPSTSSSPRSSGGSYGGGSSSGGGGGSTSRPSRGSR